MIRCLFCTFEGTRDELINHSANCAGHPITHQLELLARPLARILVEAKVIEDVPLTGPQLTAAAADFHPNQWFAARLRQMVEWAEEHGDEAAAQRYTLRKELKKRFPWLGTDESVSGADVIEALADWYESLGGRGTRVMTPAEWVDKVVSQTVPAGSQVVVDYVHTDDGKFEVEVDVSPGAIAATYFVPEGQDPERIAREVEAAMRESNAYEVLESWDEATE